MTVRAHYQIAEKPIEAMDLSITITMTVSEWREYVARFPSPSGQAGYYVKEAIVSALHDISAATGRHYSYPSPERT